MIICIMNLDQILGKLRQMCSFLIVTAWYSEVDAWLRIHKYINQTPKNLIKPLKRGLL